MKSDPLDALACRCLCEIPLWMEGAELKPTIAPFWQRFTEWINHVSTENGKTQCLTAWARDLGINPSTLNDRLKRGWALSEALSLPAQKGRKPFVIPRKTRRRKESVSKKTDIQRYSALHTLFVD